MATRISRIKIQRTSTLAKHVGLIELSSADARRRVSVQMELPAKWAAMVRKGLRCGNAADTLKGAMHTLRNSFQFVGLQLICRVLLIAGGVGLAMAGDSGNQESVRLSRESCAGLQGLSIPASTVGLPNSGALVQTAAFVAASDTGNSNGDFCKVTGIVKPHNPSSPNLEFEVNLPAAWNRRALQMGGGGYDGSLVSGLTPYSNQTPNSDTPLKQGYVTLGSDGGHKGKAGFDGSFGMDDEALLNFGKQSVKKTHDAALAVVQKAYGQRPDTVLLYRRVAGRA